MRNIRKSVSDTATTNFYQNKVYATIINFDKKVDTDKAWDSAKEIVKAKDRDYVTIQRILYSYEVIFTEHSALVSRIQEMLATRSKFSTLYNSRELHPSNNKK